MRVKLHPGILPDLFSQAFLFPGVPFPIWFPLRSWRGSILSLSQQLAPAGLPNLHLPGCWYGHRKVPQLPGDGGLCISSYLLSPHRNSVIRGKRCLWLLLTQDLAEHDPVLAMRVVLVPSMSCRMSQSFRVF